MKNSWYKMVFLATIILKELFSFSLGIDIGSSKVYPLSLKGVKLL